MPLNYASVDKNASQYAQQAQDWLLECKKIAGQLNTLYDEAVSDPERLRQMIELVQESKSNLYLAKPLQEDPLRSYPPPPCQIITPCCRRMARRSCLTGIALCNSA